MNCTHGRPLDEDCPCCLTDNSDIPDLAEAPEVGSHRFADWQPGTHYAFARGLTVSPQHLALALDTMEDAGWTLHAIFGETSADKIGFIFKRRT